MWFRRRLTVISLVALYPFKNNSKFLRVEAGCISFERLVLCQNGGGCLVVPKGASPRRVSFYCILTKYIYNNIHIHCIHVHTFSYFSVYFIAVYLSCYSAPHILLRIGRRHYGSNLVKLEQQQQQQQQQQQ